MTSLVGPDNERNTGPDWVGDSEVAASGASCPTALGAGLGVVAPPSEGVAAEEVSRIGVGAGKTTASGVEAGRTTTRGFEDAAGDGPAFAIFSGVDEMEEDGSAPFSLASLCLT